MPDLRRASHRDGAVGGHGRIGVCHWSLDRDGPDALARASELGFSAMHLDGDELARDSWLPDGPVNAAIYAEAAARTGVAHHRGLAGPPQPTRPDEPGWLGGGRIVRTEHSGRDRRGQRVGGAADLPPELPQW